MSASPVREPLNRDRVLRAAVALADAEGLGAVSMRRLAERLGVVPMALYKHVADKEDLFDGLVDAVIGEFAGGAGRTEPAPNVSAWTDALRAAVLAARATLLRHPWARRAIETRSRRTPAVLAHMDRLTGILLAGGLSADLAHHAMHALGNRIWGFSPELFNDPEGVAEPAAPAPLDPANYPAILAVAADATARRPEATGCDEEFEFRFALDLILGGVARLHEHGWTSDGAARTSA